MAHIITVGAIKGGTGKTATAGTLAHLFSRHGLKALAIDLDPQASLTIWMRADPTEPGAYDAITGRQKVTSCIQETESGVDVLAASADLSAITTARGSGWRLNEALEPITGYYDFIIIDTSPAMGELQSNALHASDGLLIPLETDSSSLQGMYQMLDVAGKVQEANASLEVLGAVLTKYDPRAKINRKMEEVVREAAAKEGIAVLATIRQGVAVREAMATRVCLFDSSPTSNPALDYAYLFNVIYNRLK